MKNIIKYLIIGLPFFAISCTQDCAEIVEQNNSLELDKNAYEVNMPKKDEYNVSNLIRFTQSNFYLLKGANTADGFSLNPASIKLTFQLKRPVNRDVVMELTNSPNSLIYYNGLKVNFLPLPNECCEGLEFTIPANTTKVEYTLNLSRLDLLKQQPGYITALQLKAKDESLGIEPTRDCRFIFVKILLSDLENKQNTEFVPTNTTYQEWHGESIQGIRAATSVASYDASQLLEGDMWGENGWNIQNPNGSDKNWVILKFAKQKVQGFFITTNYFATYRSERYLKSLKVYVSDDDGATWYDQGTVQLQDKTYRFAIGFIKPVEVNAIKITNIESTKKQEELMITDLSVTSYVSE